MRATIERPGPGEAARVRPRIAALSSGGPAGGSADVSGPKQTVGLGECCVAAFPNAAVCLAPSQIPGKQISWAGKAGGQRR
ncbi:hypothetical protein FKW81_17575 [Rhodobacter capsulatus]|nr:hypothetical protein FKW81_17575 [Rhodobacter capsulatus]